MNSSEFFVLGLSIPLHISTAAKLKATVCYPSMIIRKSEKKAELTAFPVFIIAVIFFIIGLMTGIFELIMVLLNPERLP
ncbi:MAG: hypothetical protein LAT67_10175 [Balneolales bacterium]|nr:hypothetical protein [Balneolales bacterium]